jgi:hypothetical protein
MMLWCELHHTSGAKGSITNFEHKEYADEMEWLETVGQVRQSTVGCR